MRISSAIGTNNSTLTSILAAINSEPVPAGSLPIDFETNNQQGPHAKTTNITYTVPVAKIAIISGMAISISVDTAPSTPGLLIAVAEFTPDGDSAIPIFSMNWQPTVIDISHANSIACNYRMQAGDNLIFASIDLSIGSVINWSMAATIVEYDAA